MSGSDPEKYAEVTLQGHQLCNDSALKADEESEPFWSRYASLNDGIAIKTSVRKLIDSIGKKCDAKNPYSSLVLKGAIEWLLGLNCYINIAVYKIHAY